MKSLSVVVLLTLGIAACAAPPPAPEPAAPSMAVTESLQTPYGFVKGYLTQAAEQAPETLYAFQATPDVRTLGQILAHVADANFMFCGAASGEQGPADSAEQTLTAKADIQQALADSFAFCDQAFAGVDDTTGAAEATADMMGMTTTKLGVLSFATAHQFEHYGNIVTYLRLNDMVPPSSQPADGM